MSIKLAIQHNLLDNPIVRLESTTLKRQSGKWFARFFYLVSIFVMLIPVMWGFGHEFYGSLNVTLTLLVILNAIAYFVVALKAVTTANDSTYRERRGKTWELLMLTGVSNWRMVFGKWLGVMRHLLKDFAWLYVLRVAVLFWFAVYQSTASQYPYNCLYAYSSCEDVVKLSDASFGHEFLTHALLLMLVFTVLELMASTAIGMSTAFFNWNSRNASAAAVMFRVGLGVAIPLLVYFVLFQISRVDPYWMSNNISQEAGLFGLRTMTIFADNGMVGMAYLFNPYTPPAYQPIFWASNWVSMGLYGLVTILALQMAATRAFFGGISLASDKTPDVKAKRMIEPAPYPRPIPNTQAHPNRLFNEHGQANAFGIKGASLRLMEVYHYQRRLGRMILRVTGEGEPIYIQLDNVLYIEAPAFWKGANLNTATDNEYRVFLNEKHLAVSSLAEETMRLYWNDAGVRIVAGSAEILEDLPANI